MRLVANCHRKTLSLIGFFSITLIFLFAQISSVYAGSFTVYGPEAFERTAGSKNSFTVEFQAPITRDTYQIHIQSDSVTSAVVRINGNVIFTPSSFSNKVSELNKTVSLQTNNQLYVELRGNPGSLLTINRITGVRSEWHLVKL